MIDITHKSNTLRIATAQAIVATSSLQTVEAVINKTVPKGDVLEIARAAGMFAVKRTSDMIPDCHPLPIESTKISYEINGLEIKVIIEVKTIYKTGVEVEAMHGASVVALTLYDMLKPIDKGIEIQAIRLVEKKGGKSDQKKYLDMGLTAAVVVCSDSVSAGLNEDKSGKYIREKLQSLGLLVEDYSIVPDDADAIRQKAEDLCKSGIQVIIFTGGTGLSKRDITPEAIRPMLDREMEGIMETARSYGQQRMPFSMLSRGIAGIKGKSLILTFPGSLNAAKEYMDALFPHVLHVFNVMDGAGH